MITANPALKSTLLTDLSSIFVPHSRFESIYGEVRDVIELAPCPDAPCLHVSGPSGVGKTTLRNRLTAEFPTLPDARRIKLLRQVVCADHIRLLDLRMPPQPTVKSLAREMLRLFGDDEWYRGDEFMVGDRVDRYIEGCGTAAVMIDDAQRAIDRTGVVVSEKLVDWLKERHERHGISLILLGLGRLRYLFEADDQIERRWDAELRLEPYRWGRDEDANLGDRADFIGVLASFSELSPLPFALDVTDEAVAFRFYYATRGLTGYLAKLLQMAMRIAMREPHDRVNAELLEQAFERAFRAELHHMSNPFSAGFEARLPPPLDDDRILVAEMRDQKPLGMTKKRFRRAVLDRTTK